jgi:hypothetical protein
MSSLDLQEKDGGYLVTKRGDSGREESIWLSEDDVLTLSQSAAGLRQSILAKRSPESGGVAAVFATIVAQFSVVPDTLSQDVLLTLVGPNGAQTIFAIPPEVAPLLADRLPKVVAEIASAKPTRQ